MGIAILAMSIAMHIAAYRLQTVMRQSPFCILPAALCQLAIWNLVVIVPHAREKVNGFR